LTFRGKVTEHAPPGLDSVRVEFGSPTKIYWRVCSEDILSHEPRAFQIGDIVTWGSRDVNYEIVAIKINGIIVYHPLFAPNLIIPSKLTLVRPADET
jgi:hypothetical protein